jgi:F-type H+-transporting ATPase subunit epsilon
MSELFLEVVTPEAVIVSQEVDMVVAPGSKGEFGVLPGHIHFLTSLIPGELRFTQGNNREYLAISYGFAEISDDRVSILVDTAEKAREIDIERAQKALERARNRIEKVKEGSDIDFLRAELALKKAIARIKVTKKSE